MKAQMKNVAVSVLIVLLLQPFRASSAQKTQTTQGDQTTYRQSGTVSVSMPGVMELNISTFDWPGPRHYLTAADGSQGNNYSGASRRLLQVKRKDHADENEDSSVLDVSFSGGSARIGRKLLGSASGAVVAASLAASGRVLLDTASLPPLPALPPLTPLPQPSPLPALAPTPVNIDFPGGSVDVNRSGVDVQFPGGEVNIGRKLLRAGEEVPQTGVASRDHQEGTLLIEMQTAGSEGLKIAKEMKVRAFGLDKGQKLPQATRVHLVLPALPADVQTISANTFVEEMKAAAEALDALPIVLGQAGYPFFQNASD